MAKTTHVESIEADIKFGRSDDSVIIFIPSKDRNGDPVKDQAIWANEAADLFATLFQGSTGFKNLIGTWHDEKSGKVIAEQPIMIQSLTKRERIENRENLQQLLSFCKRMGRKTNQACVGLAINDVFYYISDYGGA